MTTNQRLLSFIQRIERLEEEKRTIMADISEIKKDAKNSGFDTKIINLMLKERRMSDYERREYLDLAEIYRAALGMLDGTPLGDFARKRLSEQYEPKKPEKQSAENESKAPEAPEPAEEVDQPADLTPEDIANSRNDGGAAAASGKKITENPHAFGDPRRAAWDEGFCATTGSDGMEVPQAWRRKGKQAEKQPDGDAK